MTKLPKINSLHAYYRRAKLPWHQVCIYFQWVLSILISNLVDMVKLKNVYLKLWHGKMGLKNLNLSWWLQWQTVSSIIDKAMVKQGCVILMPHLIQIILSALLQPHSLHKGGGVTYWFAINTVWTISSVKNLFNATTVTSQLLRATNWRYILVIPTKPGEWPIQYDRPCLDNADATMLFALAL